MPIPGLAGRDASCIWRAGGRVRLAGGKGTTTQWRLAKLDTDTAQEALQDGAELARSGVDRLDGGLEARMH